MKINFNLLQCLTSLKFLEIYGHKMFTNLSTLIYRAALHCMHVDTLRHQHKTCTIMPSQYHAYLISYAQHMFFMHPILSLLHTFLIRVLWNVMVILNIGFQILIRFFCVAYGICTGRNFIL